MNIDNYKILISNLPVRQQSFSTKRTTWQKAEKEIKWLYDLNDKLFENHKTLNISRQDLLNMTNSTRELILKTIYWGYPAGMRGNHFVNILQHIELLETTLNDLKSNVNSTSNNFRELTKTLKGISGLGLSTYSKLLYFFNIKFNNNPCLILDQRLIDVFASKFYYDFPSLEKINYDNAEAHYLDFLENMNNLSIALQTQGEKIEQFLFMFGNNLKKEKIPKIEISQMWNGYCPESLLKGKQVRMRLNHGDFYESEETRLQICVLSGVQAIILKFRGEGKFRLTSKFADEIETGEILSPQNTDRPPFNNPSEVFQESTEIEDYIKAIKQ